MQLTPHQQRALRYIYEHSEAATRGVARAYTVDVEVKQVGVRTAARLRALGLIDTTVDTGTNMVRIGGFTGSVGYRKEHFANMRAKPTPLGASVASPTPRTNGATARRRKNGRRVVAYLTQYGAWWSATEEQWRRLASVGMGQVPEKSFQARGETYGEYDLDESATRLSGRPSSIRVEHFERSGRGGTAYHSMIPVIRPLDFTPSDWRYADEEVRRHIATVGRSPR